MGLIAGLLASNALLYRCQQTILKIKELLSHLATTATALTTTTGGARSLLALTLSTLGVLLSLLLRGSGSGLASMLDANLPLENLFSTKLLDGTLSLLLGGQVDESVANSTAGARMSGNRGRLARNNTSQREAPKTGTRMRMMMATYIEKPWKNSLSFSSVVE